MYRENPAKHLENPVTSSSPRRRCFTAPRNMTTLRARLPHTSLKKAAVSVALRAADFALLDHQIILAQNRNAFESALSAGYIIHRHKNSFLEQSLTGLDLVSGSEAVKMRIAFMGCFFEILEGNFVLSHGIIRKQAIAYAFSLNSMIGSGAKFRL